MKYEKEHGFTIVELLVAMLIAATVMAAIFMVYRSQQKSYITQEQVAVIDKFSSFITFPSPMIDRSPANSVVRGLYF